MIDFITNNYVLLLVIGGISLISLIGYFVKYKDSKKSGENKDTLI